MAKCLCKLEIVPVQINLSCPWHGHLEAENPVVSLQPDGIYQLGALKTAGRWRCPVCNHWVDEKAGWRIIPEEEICLRCFTVLKGGKIDEPTDTQWSRATE